jgi:HlyD family secretion protein
VRQEDITSRVRAPGKIEAKTQVKVSADIMGKIVVLAVKEGDPVRRGQLMLQLDDRQYRAYHDQATATAGSARARLREAEQALRAGEATYRRQEALFAQ